jgi:hypothetical protein
MATGEIVVSGEEALKIAESLTSTTLKILQMLSKERLDVSTIATRLEAYMSEQIRLLEDLKLINFRYEKGKRGIRKICQSAVKVITIMIKPEAWLNEFLKAACTLCNAIWREWSAISRRRTKLLILECTSESEERMSEGRLLRELMRILGFERQTRFLLISGKMDLLRKMENMKEPYLHISAHGEFNSQKGTWINVPHSGKVFPSDITGLWKQRAKPRIPVFVVLSACETGHVDMVRAFSEAGCQYCIAPLHETYWEDAAVFSTVFYKLLIGEGMSPWVSFRKTMRGISYALPRLSGAWSFCEWGKRLSVTEQ